MTKLFDLNFDEYLKIKRISASDLMNIAKNPALYHYNKLFDTAETSSLNFGRKLHLALLEDEKFVELKLAKT